MMLPQPEGCGPYIWLGKVDDVDWWVYKYWKNRTFSEVTKDNLYSVNGFSYGKIGCRLPVTSLKDVPTQIMTEYAKLKLEGET